MSHDNRMTELEIKLAHQEKLVEELSCVVTDQWKSLDEISKKLNALTKRLLDLEERNSSEIPVERPPHW
ncbi:SlyX protein [Bartonella sp. CDC_skunk]|uniref:Protein SlyX homolog n=1 Tax=Bartonella rochalimae ATCC BAA-1498 TaxID=685782 RepID=E6YK89_9HYPH|nr:MULTISPECIES: SlyX family protein [Bartonella]AQX17941.1 SlyX protein [Bartonella sp. A1379B]AQX20862.1 SlyX protein [Bartonella sp. CDC_skunk]AQX22454.1 SlyX protein [Bartonella sp. 11B]AQX24265.1 SlyX protein [Bartonella sp. 114]AQX24902.1 SlyX protein [Bartonella sp. Coyote22sub2]